MKPASSVALLVVVFVAAGCGRSEDAATTTLLGGTTATTGVKTTTTSPPTTTTVPTTTAPTTIVPTTMVTTTTTTTTMLGTTTTATGVKTTTTLLTTTTAVPTTTRPGADGRYVVGEPGVFPRPDTTTGPLLGSEGAGGSGCAPGTTTLPDGIWFGFVTAKADTSIMFDLACFFFGAIATEEGAKDDVDVDNEIYIRNANPTLRTITVNPSVLVYEYLEDLADTLEVPFSPVPFADWPQDPTFPNPCPGQSCGVWLFVNDAAVTEMLEQLVVP